MKSTYRELLGVTQEDLSLLLQVSRSQLSLFEIGKRDLPATAKLKLAEMLSYSQNSFKKKGTTIDTTIQENEKEKIIKDFLFVNLRKQRAVKKKIASLEKKQQNSIAALHLSEFLNTSESKNPSYILADGIELKAKNNLEKNSLKEIYKLQIKLELLEIEEKHLKSK
jgi:transcriptional regulator with XRE-family HTH domain